MRELRISVRALVEFVLRSGDIDHRFISHSRALEGTRLHQKIQKNYGEGFEAEVPLRMEIPLEDSKLIIEGRCDGIYRDESQILVDEIKSTQKTREELESQPNKRHWAQVFFYGYILCQEESLEEVTLRLTYISLEEEEVFHFEKTLDAQVLAEKVEPMIDQYLQLQRLQLAFEKKSTESIQALNFPYGDFRKGQRDLAVSVYNMIQNKDQLLVEAATGIGKTMATLFPSIKAIGEGLVLGIYYATGRGTQKRIAQEAYDLLASKGLLLRALVLTAKEKLCLNDEVHCHPDFCPYAKGHYDRVGQAIFQVLENKQKITSEDLQACGEEYTVCPFELQLDMIQFSKLIIGDYNYIYHPRVELDSIEERAKNFVLLVDESHNLIDRGRDMYSLTMSAQVIEDLVKLPEVSGDIEKNLRELSEFIKSHKGSQVEFPKPVYKLLVKLSTQMERQLMAQDEDLPDLYLDFYFKVLEWLDLETYYSQEDFVFHSPSNHEIQVLCLDTHKVLGDRTKAFCATIYFSATLSPMDYYTYFLGLKPTAHKLKLTSPFNPDHLLVLHQEEIKTTYRHRSESIQAISDSLKTLVEARPGNYLFFFPSYQFLNEVYEFTKDWDRHGLVQSPTMTPKGRRDFLDQFRENNDVHGYVVMGGIFSEGIDLVGEDLVGGVIISLGLPGLSPERELMKVNFNQKGLAGYDYTYTIPGLVKVIQSAGRIIRSHEDRGILILMDQRYSQAKIRNLLPDSWRIQAVRGRKLLEEKIKEFWRNYDT